MEAENVAEPISENVAGQVKALREIATDLRQGEFLPGGSLYDDAMTG